VEEEVEEVVVLQQQMEEEEEEEENIMCRSRTCSLGLDMMGCCRGTENGNSFMS